MSFKNMKKNRGALADKLKAAAKDAGSGGKPQADDRYWRLTVNKDGNGSAVIRFLPAAEGEELPWAQYWDHMFKGPTGRWYIEKSLTTLGQDDPVSELNRELWNDESNPDGKAQAREQKRKLHYVSNILVINDPANPENNGKVFLFEYGKKIFDKLMDSMEPQFEDETPVNPFDFWEGANFRLRSATVDGYRNYDKSTFDGPEELFGGDEAKLEAVYNSLYSLKEFTDPETFKSYAELEKKLNAVLGRTPSGNAPASMESADTPELKSAPAKSEAIDSTPNIDIDTDDDGDMDYFANMANED